MSMRFFSIPVVAPEPQAGELNQFLLDHPYAVVDDAFIAALEAI